MALKTVTDTLQDLIRIPSASSISNRDVVAYASLVFERAGWKTLLAAYLDSGGVEKNNLIAAPSGENLEEVVVDLAIICHTDTVPPASDWAAAFDPYVDAGFVYGCGACDVKGFLACLLVAVKQTRVAALRSGLRIVLTADEEVGCLGSQHLLAAEKLRPRSLVVGEPTSLHPARAGKGYCVAVITIFGTEAHSAHPRHGRSAIYDAAKVIQAVERLSTKLTQVGNSFFDPPYTTINIGTIQGGTAKNIIPAECRMLLEWRPVPGQSADVVPQSIRETLAEMARADAAFRYEFKILRQQTGFETRSESNLVRTLERLSGRPSISIPFGSEASVFASVAEEVVVFGPGDMRFAHSPRERVPVSELEEAVCCLIALMQRV